MSKKIENELTSKNKENIKKKEEASYFDNYTNVKIREFINKNAKYGNKTYIKQELAKACGVSLSTIKRCISGYSTLNKYEQIKYLADYTGLDFNELVESTEVKKAKINLEIKRELPNDLIINGVNLHNQESYNVLCKHTYKKGNLFPMRDEFLKFLDYMICEEQFVYTISDKAQDILQSLKMDINNNTLPKDEIDKLANCKDDEDYEEAFSKGELDKRLRNLISDEKIRNSVRAFITKYIADNLK